MIAKLNKYFGLLLLVLALEGAGFLWFAYCLWVEASIAGGK